MSDQVVTKPSATITLGGADYTIEALPMKRARAWRAEFQKPLETIIGVLQNADNIEINGAADIAALLNQLGGLLLGSMDILANALFKYCPYLNRDEIEETATDEEALAALWEVLKLAYPFGNLVAMVSRGAARVGTSKNSRSANGAGNRTR